MAHKQASSKKATDDHEQEIRYPIR